MPSEFLPPCMPLPDEKYSLLPDMIFGWKPKMEFGAPIPLKFASSRLDNILSEYYSNPAHYIKEKGMRVIYHGLRPADSFKMHAQFQGPNTYTIRNSRLMFEKYQILSQYVDTNEFSQNRPYLGMDKNISANDLHFDSCFESGNLDVVIQRSYNEYDLYMRVDTNTRGHTNWYLIMYLMSLSKSNSVGIISQ